MIKILLTSVITMSTLFAGNYMGKIKPIEEFSIFSETNGTIKNINIEELKYTKKDNTSIKIDDKIERTKLKNLKNKLKNLKNVIDLKNKNFITYNKLASVSQVKKDDKKIEILNLKSNLFDLKNNIQDLEDIINKKNIKISKGYFIKDIKVFENETINNGKVLIDIENHNKGKIEIFVHKEDIEKIKNRDFKISFTNSKNNEINDIDEIIIDKSIDSKYVSSYKVILISNDIKNFGSIVTVTIEK